MRALLVLCLLLMAGCNAYEAEEKMEQMRAAAGRALEDVERAGYPCSSREFFEDDLPGEGLGRVPDMLTIHCNGEMADEEGEPLFYTLSVFSEENGRQRFMQQVHVREELEEGCGSMTYLVSDEWVVSAFDRPLIGDLAGELDGRIAYECAGDPGDYSG